MEKELFKNKMGPPPPSLAFRTKENCKPVSWENYFAKEEIIEISGKSKRFRVYSKGDKGPVFFFLHGGGHSALSWALTVSKMDSSCCRLFAYDCRGHGGTVTENDSDLSTETLISDCIELIITLFASTDHIILVGHSMGGAIAAKAAACYKKEASHPTIAAVVVIDVVEETALNSLSHMHNVLDRRPSSFRSLEDAIQWSISSGTLKNIESARVSIPPQLVKQDDKYVWKTNLFESEPYWKEWFTNLSKTFLSVKAIKVLILAGTDRLDKELTIAQMQGKYQLILLPKCGHVIQEDDPQNTAKSLMHIKERYHL